MFTHIAKQTVAANAVLVGTGLLKSTGCCLVAMTSMTTGDNGKAVATILKIHVATISVSALN